MTSLMFRPVIFTVCYGRDEYYDALALFLESLGAWGAYDGPVIVVADRSEEEVMTRYVHLALQSRVRVVQKSNLCYSSRFDVADMMGPFDGPILYLDTDIVVGRPILEILQRISTSPSELFICDETRHFADHIVAPVAGLSEPLPRFSHWFGYDMMLADERTRDAVMPMANSGAFAYSNRRTLERIEGIIAEARQMPGAAEIEGTYTDQPIFNYAAARDGNFSRKELTDHTDFWNVNNEPSFDAHFHHFLWAKGVDKPGSMARLMKRLPSAS